MMGRVSTQIVIAALSKCQELLRQIAEEASSSAILGIAPSRCYAALVNDYVEDPFELFAQTKYRPVRNWVFGADYIEELADMDKGPAFHPINKAFFHEGKFVVAVSGDGRRCLIDFQVGPLYGRCLIYKVHLRDGRCSLEQIAVTRTS